MPARVQTVIRFLFIREQRNCRQITDADEVKDCDVRLEGVEYMDQGRES